MAKQLSGAKHRVVYTASGNKLASARTDDPTQIFEHKLYWMPARNISEARYLVGVLNTPALTTAVSEYQSRGLFGPRDFDTYVWRLPIPTFDSQDDLHNEIVDLSRRAEEVAESINVGNYGFQKARGIVRSALDEAGINPALDHALAQLLDLPEIDPNNQ